MGENCYSTTVINFDKGLFDSFVDITYVITLRGSSRKASILNQINKFKPTKKVIIVENTPFKHCNKDICGKPVNKTSLDLIHANRYIWKISQGYNNILVLEDDAIFSERLLKKPEIIQDIRDFILLKNPLSYSLGSIHIISSMLGSHRKLLAKGGAHAMIHSKIARKTLLDKCDYAADDIDFHTSFDTWGYKETLVGQVFEETANSKNWIFGLTSFIQPVLYYFTKDDSISGINNMNTIFWILQLLIIIFILKEIAILLKL